MIIINNTARIIFAAGKMLKPGTNIIQGLLKFNDFEKKKFIENTFIKIVDEKRDCDNIEAIKHSTNKEIVKSISGKSRSKSVKCAAEKKEKELDDFEKEYKKQIEEAKNKSENGLM